MTAAAAMCAVIPLLTATALLLAVQIGFTRAVDTCYYPDGSISDKDLPCSSSNGGVACCPQGWTCMSNGFCYLDYEDYISRYTCTDQSWKSGGCPNYCLGGAQNGTDTGNVALLDCGGKYCCNGDRSGDCCKDKAASFFTMNDDQPVDEPTSTGFPSESAQTITATATKSASRTEHTSFGGPPPITPSTTVLPTTIVTSVISNPTDGAASTVYLTMTATPSSTASPNAGNSSSSNKSVVVGCAVGIPLSLALVGLLAFLLFRRHRRRCADNSILPPPTIPGYQEKSPRVSELDGFPRAAGGSIAPHRSSAMANSFYGGKAGSRHGRTASEADGTPVIAKQKRHRPPPAELESPKHRPTPFELEATEAGTGAGYFRGPTPAAAAARVASSQASSPGPTGYAVGATAPGGLRIVNVVEGELEDSEVDGDGEGEGERERGKGVEKVESPPPSYQSPKSWRLGRWGESWRSNGGAGEGSSAAVAGAAPGGIGSPVSPLQSQGPGGWR